VQVVGRDRELERLERLLEAPGSLVLLGEPGIGKTTLWEAGIAAALGRGFRVLRGAPAEAEASLAFAGLDDLLAGVDGRVFDELPPPQREALDVALLRTAPPPAGADPRAVFAAFRSVLAALAAVAPVLLAIDDLQWLDASSAAALAYASRRLRDLPVVLLGAMRTNGGFADWTQLRVAPLSAGALHQLIKARVGVNLPRPAILRLHESSGGNPFLALELARAVDGEMPDGAGPWPATRDARELVEAQLAALPTRTRRALLALAAGGASIEAGELDAAVQSGLVSVDAARRARFAHPLYASAVYHGAHDDERRAVHAQLARGSATAEERARHLGLAVAEADAAVADELAAAGGQAAARGAPEAAATLLERAAELSVGSADAARRALAAAELHLQTGATTRAAELLSQLTADAPDDLRAAVLHRLALVRFREERFAEAIPLLHEAAAEPAVDARVHAAIELDLAFISLSASLDHRPAIGHARTAVEHAQRSGDTPLIAAALAVRALADFLNGNGVDEEQLARALELEDESVPLRIEMRPTLVAGFLAAFVGDVERARSLLYPLRDRMRELGQEAELPLLSIHLSWLECLVGNMVAAQALCDEALELAELSRTMTTHAHAYAAVVAASCGDEGRCRHHVATALNAPLARQQCLVLIWIGIATALLELPRENFGAAHEALAWLTEFYEQQEVVDPVHLMFVPDEIEALVGLGETKRAAALTDFLTANAVQFGRPAARAAAHRCRALVLAADGDLASAEQELDAALREHERAPLPLEVARTLVVRGVVERRLRRKARARTALERAAAICDEIGATWWGLRARKELARIGTTRAADELTPTEARVAELAASGLTNREVAAAAFISQKTVEANLSRIYRKLGIRSRAQLGTKLASR
jgi:DNA-binding NarL/FixJ family response regulator